MSQDKQDQLFDSSISNLYQASTKDAPPDALDQKILQAAKDQLNKLPVRSKTNWKQPLSVAATVLICATLVLFIGEDAYRIEDTLERETFKQAAKPAPQTLERTSNAQSDAPSEPQQNETNTFGAPELAPADETLISEPESVSTIIQSSDVPKTRTTRSRELNYQDQGLALEKNESEHSGEQEASKPSQSTTLEVLSESPELLNAESEDSYEYATVGSPAQNIEENPDLWIEHIENLRNLNLRQDMIEQFKRFHEAYPNYDLMDYPELKRELEEQM